MKKCGNSGLVDGFRVNKRKDWISTGERRQHREAGEKVGDSGRQLGWAEGQRKQGAGTMQRECSGTHTH